MRAMQSEDPDQHVDERERGGGLAAWDILYTSGTDRVPPPRESGLRDAAKLANTKSGRLAVAGAVASVLVIVLLGQDFSKTTVHGDLIMLNSGTTGTIACNDGNLKLDGDHNTYTVTGHCRRLEVFGGANYVTVDRADTISIVGDDNVVIYRSGSATANQTGHNNVISQRSSTRN